MEDFNVQSCPEVSPIKWHLGHTTWFFETFILKNFEKGYKEFHPKFNFIFNSYYNSVGEQWIKENRHLLFRPSLLEIYKYRRIIDERITKLLVSEIDDDNFFGLVELGINHEQQHQELMMTDIKHIYFKNPLDPKYQENSTENNSSQVKKDYWITLDEGIYQIGKMTEDFSFDNETPRHKHFQHQAKLSSALVRNQDYLEFINEGGYQRPEFWLSDGWKEKEKRNWTHPLYWKSEDKSFLVFTLSGYKLIKLNEPVSHISFYEADAFANWRGFRLPTEFEWEIIAAQEIIEGNFLESKNYHPIRENHQVGIFGNLWQWTQSSYQGYPGYRSDRGAVGEYNGKFMNNQRVLRGGSCVTPKDHIRPTYRNYWAPETRWQFTGIRLAKDS